MGTRVVLVAIVLAGVFAPQADAVGVFGEGQTTLVSGAPGSDAPLSVPMGETRDLSISGDGRYAVFSLRYPALAGTDEQQVWRRDMQTGELQLVSRATGTTGTIANASAQAVGISDNGEVVAFLSDATNLTGVDTHDATQLYTRQLTGSFTTTLRSHSSSGAAADHFVADAALGGDGDVVTFTTAATNFSYAEGGKRQVYRQGYAFVMSLPITELISRDATTASAGANADALAPTVSHDGAVVGFVSAAKNLTDPADDGDHDDLYIRSGATLTHVTDYANNVIAPKLSGNGQFVVFRTAQPLGGTGDTNTDLNIYRTSNLGTGPKLIDAPDGTTSTGNYPATAAGATPDFTGGHVVFSSFASNLVAGDTNGKTDVFVRTIASNATQRVSLADDGSQATKHAESPASDATASHVGFLSASALAPGSDAQIARAYLRDVSAGHTVLISRSPDLSPLITDGSFESPVMTPDARFVAFTAQAPGLTGLQSAGVYVRDMVTGSVELVQAVDGSFPSVIGISDDGRRVAFRSDSAMLGTPNPNARYWVWVRDRVAGTTTLASTTPGGAGVDANPGDARMSADGTKVVFVTDAIDAKPEAYERDLAAGTVTLVSRTATGDVPVTTSVFGLSVSADGSRVAFATDADLTDPIAGTDAHIYLRDLTAQSTTLVDPASSSAGLLSADGTRVAYAAPTGDYVRDTGDGSATLVNKTSDGTVVSGPPQVVAFSPDGKAVGLLSNAPELGGVKRFSVRYLDTGATVTASITAAGSAYADNYNPNLLGLSRDGGCALLYSSGQAGPFTPNYGYPAIWMRSVRGSCPVLPAVVTPTPTPTPSPTPGGAKDTTAPKLSKVTVTRTRKRATAHFTLSERARVTITIKRRGKKPSTLTHKGVRKGKRTQKLPGKLKAGRYTVTLRASDAAGNRSKRVVRRFKVKTVADSVGRQTKAPGKVRAAA